MTTMKTNMIDTHCHLEQEEFFSDLDAVAGSASSKGIRCITSGITPQDWQRSIDISIKYSNIDVSIGLDPMQYKHVNICLEFIRKHEMNLVSIGEVGLDHYRERDHKEREGQEQSFRKFIEISEELKLPIQIHSRSAGKRCIEVLSSMNASNVHMHAFDGKASLARNASNDMGYYFSIPTSVKRSPQKQKLVKAVNIERIMIETDSPVLSPERGTRNTPTNLPIALQEVSRILRRDEEEMRAIILENSYRLYKKMR